MRLLHVTPFYEPCWAYGGIARAVAAQCRALAARGHEVTVATALLEPGLPCDERRGGVRVRRFAGPRWLAERLVPFPRGLAEFLRRELDGFDVCHLHGVRSGLSALTARQLAAAGRRFALTTHGCQPHHGRHRLLKAAFDGLAGRAVLAGAGQLIAISEAEARDLARPARVIPNGVEPVGAAPALEPAGGEPQPAPRHGAAAERGAPPGARLLFVGSDAPQKRGTRLCALLEALPEARLELVGRCSPRFLEAFRHFGSRVRARGVLAGEELAAAYAAADLLVHPAVGEAFGLVTFEAAFAGTAPVVAGGHGCGEWIARAGGCVVRPDDPAALLAAVRARLEDPALARAEAAAVARYACRELTWSRVAAALEDTYRGLLP